VFHDARHPYTRGLLASIPGGTSRGRLQAIPGAVPALGDLPPGCPFAPRCAQRFEPCDKAVPGMTLLRPITGGSHETRCYLYSPAVDPETLPEQGG
jgi:oligopeptide/dipeptide ABC transporter ATP-binding protein